VFYDLDHRVQALFEPVGSNLKTICTYNFFYGKDQTIVINPALLKIQYLFSDHRLTQINYFSTQTRDIFSPAGLEKLPKPHFCFLRQESFEWSEKPFQEGWLKSKSVGIGDHLFHLKAFEYDRQGNILVERIYGNLSGRKEGTFERHKKEHTDHCTLRYAYTDDGRNLVSEKSTSEGLKTPYAYLPENNLRTKEVQIYDGKIQEELFREFDENGQISRIIQDDGSGEEAADLTDVTFRQMKKIFSCKEKNTAFFGKPEKIVELKGNAQGELQRIKTCTFSYDKNGNETKQIVYDSNNEFCYETTKSYDKRQRLKESVDPLGQTTVYQYGEANNRIYEELKGSGKVTQYEYDLFKRLIAKIESHLEGERFITTYAYDAVYRLVSEIDSYSHQTDYEYDHLGRQTSRIKPAIWLSDQQKWQRPVSRKEYNPLNQAISCTDENGNTTHYKYNIYGKPTEILYPDGTAESNLYYRSGWLKQKNYADGTSTAFTYDAKGNVLTGTFSDKNEQPLKEVSYGYKGSLFQFKQDVMGLVTTYSYDEKGRKIREIIGEGLKEIHYRYDDFDRLIEIRSLPNQETRIESYRYD